MNYTPAIRRTKGSVLNNAKTSIEPTIEEEREEKSARTVDGENVRGEIREAQNRKLNAAAVSIAVALMLICAVCVFTVGYIVAAAVFGLSFAALGLLLFELFLVNRSD